MSIIKRKAGSEDIVKSILEFDEVPTEGSHNLVESGSVAQAIGNLGQPLQWKGPATVAQLNTGITGIQPGWTYTLTDAGTLTDGSVDVEVGDEVAWTEDGEWFQVGPSLVELKADVAQAKSDIADIQDVVPEEASDSNKLVTKDELDNVQESIQSGFTPKGEISVSDLNDLTTQSNGDQYILTDSGTITDGSVTVEAGDSVAWNSTDSVWYKVKQYALSKYGTDEIKNLPTSITSFRTGDVIPVDGPDGTAKMSKDDLLNETAQNALVDNVAPAFVPNETDAVAGKLYIYQGKCYRCKVNTSGSWNAGNFERVSIDDMITYYLVGNVAREYDYVFGVTRNFRDKVGHFEYIPNNLTCVIPCSEGDKFWISGVQSSTIAKVWSTQDDTGTIKRRAAESLHVDYDDNYIVTIQKGETSIVFNSATSVLGIERGIRLLNISKSFGGLYEYLSTFVRSKKFVYNYQSDEGTQFSTLFTPGITHFWALLEKTTGPENFDIYANDSTAVLSQQLLATGIPFGLPVEITLPAGYDRVRFYHSTVAGVANNIDIYWYNKQSAEARLDEAEAEISELEAGEKYSDTLYDVKTLVASNTLNNAVLIGGYSETRTYCVEDNKGKVKSYPIEAGKHYRITNCYGRGDEQASKFATLSQSPAAILSPSYVDMLADINDGHTYSMAVVLESLEFTATVDGYVNVCSMADDESNVYELGTISTKEAVHRLSNQVQVKPSTNQWFGKKIAWFGTSVSFGQYATESYVRVCRDKLGFELVQGFTPGESLNCAYDAESGLYYPLASGSTSLSKAEYVAAKEAGLTSIVIPDSPFPWVPGGAYNNYYRCYDNIINNSNADTDLWVFEFAPNNTDWSLDDWDHFNFETWSYDDNKTFAEHRKSVLGAIIFLMDKIYTLNPKARFVFVLTSSYGYANGKAVAEKLAEHNCVVIDIWKKINKSGPSMSVIKSEGGTNNHPSTFAHQVMGNMLANELLLVN